MLEESVTMAAILACFILLAMSAILLAYDSGVSGDIPKGSIMVYPKRSIFTYVRRRDWSDGNKISEEFVCREGTWMGFQHTVFNLKYPACVADFSAENRLARSTAFGFMVGARIRVDLNEGYTNGGKPYEIYELAEQRYLYGGIERVWQKHQFQKIQTPEKNPDGWGHDMYCPWLTAMCSVQFEYRELDRAIVYTNIKFGCCDVPPSKLWNTIPYISHEPMLPGGPLRPRINIRSRHPPNTNRGYFADPRHFRCPAGQFIDGFASKIMYHPNLIRPAGTFDFDQSLVFIHSAFYCNSLSKEYDSTPLTTDLYKNWGEDSGEEWKDLGRHNCEDGFFTGVKLNINTDDVWQKRLRCSNGEWMGDKWDVPGIFGKLSYYVDFEGGEGELACGYGEAICGIVASFDTIDGYTVEGYHFRYLCCRVPIAERCEDSSYKMERISSGCPSNRVNQATTCIIDCVRGVSRTRSKSKGGEKASSISHNFGIEVAAEVKNVGGAAGKYAYSFGSSGARNWGTGTDDSASNSTAISIRYNIPAGSQLIVAQPRIKCNDFLIRADQASSYYTPPSACKPVDEYRKLRISYAMRPILKSRNNAYNYTIRGYGMALSNFVAPAKELNVTWEEMIGDVPNAFRKDGDLLNHKYTDFSWEKVEPSLWTRYDPKQRILVKFLIQVPDKDKLKFKPELYQVIGTCGNWIVNTKDVRMTLFEGDVERRKFVFPSNVIG